MLPDNSRIKKTAKSVFKENCVGSLTVSFACMTVAFSGTVISYLMSVFAGRFWLFLFSFLYVYLIVLPAFLGAVRYFSALIEGERVKPVSMLYYFSSLQKYKRAMHFVSSIFFAVLISVFFVMIIPGLLLVLSNSGVYKMLDIAMPIWTPILKTASIFLQILGIGIVFLINIKYYLSIYFFVSNDFIPVKDAIGLSIDISRATKVDFWLLLFSMIGYILISLPVLPLFFTMPFFMLAYVIHGKCVAVAHNESVDFSKRQYTVVAK
ncbi:MAG TPA: hypothetical protein DEW35_02180 [Ruminococcaceae bacterium]|nr:hypothetical protein [Oscillospiraceae bacterium]